MTRRPIVLALLLSLLAIGHAAAGDLPTTKPEQVGLSSDPVSKYIPAFKNQAVGLERAPAEREMTIQDLMRHTSGLTYGNRGQTEIHKMYPESSSVSSLTLTMDELIERLSRAPLLYQPGP